MATALFPQPGGGGGGDEGGDEGFLLRGAVSGGLDLVLAADTAPYLGGDLGLVLAAAAALLRPGGCLALTVDLAADEDHPELHFSGRWGHSARVVERLAAGAGLAVAATRKAEGRTRFTRQARAEAIFRRDVAVAHAGVAYVLQKPWD